MQWSKLKGQVESFFCGSLKERIELFTTWYKCGGSQEWARGSILGICITPYLIFYITSPSTKEIMKL